MLTYFVGLIVAAAQLGSDDWATREAATAQLRAAGPAAWPVLMPLACAQCPEVRSRAISLTRPAIAFLSDANAIRTWFAGDEPTPAQLAALHTDPAARRAVGQAALRLRLIDEYNFGRFLRADVDIVGCMVWGRPFWFDTAAQVDDMRRQWQTYRLAPQPREKP